MISAPLSLLLAAAAPQSATVQSPPVKQGVDAWQAGDYQKAVKAWMGPAQAGDADAQFNLAQAYKLGRGVAMDMRQAEAWYRKAADQGHAQAGAMLGLIMFQNGDRKGAMPWIVKAAETGDPRAQYVYGTALFNGDERPKDWPRAYAMMTRASAAGLPQARASLQQMDQFIPVADRQAGLAMVKAGPVAATPSAAPTRTAAAAVPAPALTRTTAAAPPPAPTRAPVQPTELPPSRVAAADVPAPKPAAAPAPKPVAKPAAKPVATAAAPATGNWRIQLGAYADAGAAQGQWSKLSGRAGLKGLSPYIVKAGAVTRLQAGPFPTRAAAATACKAATAAGSGCFPVAG